MHGPIFPKAPKAQQNALINLRNIRRILRRPTLSPG
jgi:hypothetical protein